MSAGRALLIDRLHPLDWLQQRQRHRTYRLIGGVVGGLIVGLMVGLLMGMLYGMMFGLVFGLMFGLEK
jgi:predicted lipid-binding transport protein (Tim44 family)